MQAEFQDDRLRRLMIRSWRRGTRETDLILGGFANAALSAMGAAQLDAYEGLLAEDDQDIIEWVTGRALPPEGHALLIDEICFHHGITRLREAAEPTADP